MAKTVNIEERTDLFIQEFNRLNEASELPDNKVVAQKIGIKSSSGLSNILARRQNIKPAAWQKFREIYIIKKVTEDSELPTQQIKSPEDSTESVWAMYAKSLQKDKEFLQRLVESSLLEISDRQRTLQAEIQAVQQWDAHVTAGGDKVKAEESLHYIQTLVANNREKLVKKGSRVSVSK